MVDRGDRRLRRDVEVQSNDVPDLSDYDDADIASRSVYPTDRDGTYVLALGSGGVIQPVGTVGLETNLGPKPSDRGGQGHDLDHVRSCVEDALGCRHHSWMRKAGFSPGGFSEVEIDDITRGQHQATRPRRE
jgi:hypothetical protein